MQLQHYCLFLRLAYIIALLSSAMPEIFVDEGHNVTLNCSAVGEMQWYKDGELLMNSSQITIYTHTFENSSSRISFLELYTVNGHNTGNYCCQMMNESGNLSGAKYELQVNLGKLYQSMYSIINNM